MVKIRAILVRLPGNAVRIAQTRRRHRAI